METLALSNKAENQYIKDKLLDGKIIIKIYIIIYECFLAIFKKILLNER